MPYVLGVGVLAGLWLLKEGADSAGDALEKSAIPLRWAVAGGALYVAYKVAKK